MGCSQSTPTLQTVIIEQPTTTIAPPSTRTLQTTELHEVVPVPQLEEEEDDIKNEYTERLGNVQNKHIHDFLRNIINTLKCPICRQVYNDTTCKPCTMLSGHSCCESHLQGTDVDYSIPIALRDAIGALRKIIDMLFLVEECYTIEDDDIRTRCDIYQQSTSEISCKVEQVHNPNIRDLITAALSTSECPICFERYDTKRFQPCTLSCGHSYCRSHVEEFESCPTCKTSLGQHESGYVNTSVSLARVAEAIQDAATLLIAIDCEGAM